MTCRFTLTHSSSSSAFFTAISVGWVVTSILTSRVLLVYLVSFHIALASPLASDKIFFLGMPTTAFLPTDVSSVLTSSPQLALKRRFLISPQHLCTPSLNHWICGSLAAWSLLASCLPLVRYNSIHYSTNSPWTPIKQEALEVQWDVEKPPTLRKAERAQSAHNSW